jgi:ferredoxin-thioredoxin reductase catalytic chain
MTTKQHLRARMQSDAQTHGYYLTPDKQLLDTLLGGLAANEQRYGYASCPCRMASGNKTYDADIICPCEYRDADVNEYGMCYCSLFVREDVKNDPSKLAPIPERRPQEIQDAAMEVKMNPSQAKTTKRPSTKTKSTTIPVWRCTVCGYLCARDTPPPICPICKAKAERFETFTFKP